MRKISFMLSVLALLCFGMSAVAQTRITVQGTVVDQNNQAIIGASVIEKGTTNGTVTDIDGKYKIQVSSSSATIKVSFTGYENVEISASNTVQLRNIKLKESSVMLSEVIAIGYGQVKKNDATGSVSVVNERNLNKSASVSPQQLIVGKMAGVVVTTAGGSPTDGATIRIRGGSSMSASNDPLFVVDGLALDNRMIDGAGNILSSINPNDIESFTVLKDASATAIYGSRASNGVIIITTKKGAKGKLKVDYDAKFSLSEAFKKIDVLSGDEYRALINEKYATNADADVRVRALLGTASTDWQDQIFKTAFGQDHNIGLSGTVKSTPIRASVGYTDQDGILKTSEMKRYTGNIRVSPSFLNKSLNIDLGLKGSYADNRFAQTGAVLNAIIFDPTKPVKSSEEQYQKYGCYYTWMLNGIRNVNGTRNPVAQLEQRSDKAQVKRLIGDLKIDYKMPFLPDLKATLTGGLDYASSDGKIKNDPSASWVELASSPDAQLNRDYTQDIKNEMVNFILSYKKDIRSLNSSLDAMAGTEEQHVWRKAEGHDLRVNGTTQQDGSETENYMVSFFGRFNYTFNNKYLLTATLRRDGSSRFSPETRWGLFPSAALAWRINEESFLKDMTSLSDLKLRLGYGVTGQQEITTNDYPYMGTYRLSDNYARYQFGNTFVNTLRPEGYDENIKWEETATYNVALDFGFFQGRISGTAETYLRKTNDLINTIPTPAGSNFTDRLLTNIGNLENRGYEFTLNTVPVDTKDLTWELGFNIAYNKTKITKLTSYDDPNYRGVEVGGITGGGGSNTVQVQAVGHALNTFYVYEQKYDENGAPIEGSYVDRSGDGSISIADKYYAEKPAPDVLLGFTSNLRYKNFDFSVSGRASFGNYVYDDVSSNVARYQNLTTNNFMMNLTSDINTTKFTNSQYWSDYYIKDASFFKLDNITLGYEFRDLVPTLKKQNIGLRMYASVQNILTVTSYKGIDPEVSNGIDNAIYPRPRTFVLGLSLKF